MCNIIGSLGHFQRRFAAVIYLPFFQGFHVDLARLQVQVRVGAGKLDPAEKARRIQSLRAKFQLDLAALEADDELFAP